MFDKQQNGYTALINVQMSWLVSLLNKNFNFQPSVGEIHFATTKDASLDKVGVREQ
jgi:hypothetical protein